ncbi:TPA: hypothetical protein RQJ55_000991 [Vibrio vulnificus]|nr:hypothetical protein [Vibrio vulnificus]
MGEFLQYADEVYEDIRAQESIENELSQILESGNITSEQIELIVHEAEVVQL